MMSAAQEEKKKVLTICYQTSWVVHLWIAFEVFGAQYNIDYTYNNSDIYRWYTYKNFAVPVPLRGRIYVQMRIMICWLKGEPPGTFWHPSSTEQKKKVPLRGRVSCCLPFVSWMHNLWLCKLVNFSVTMTFRCLMYCGYTVTSFSLHPCWFGRVSGTTLFSGLKHVWWPRGVTIVVSGDGTHPSYNGNWFALNAKPTGTLYKVPPMLKTFSTDCELSQHKFYDWKYRWLCISIQCTWSFATFWTGGATGPNATKVYTLLTLLLLWFTAYISSLFLSEGCSDIFLTWLVYRSFHFCFAFWHHKGAMTTSIPIVPDVVIEAMVQKKRLTKLFYCELACFLLLCFVVCWLFVSLLVALHWRDHCVIPRSQSSRWARY